jgi:hypothetical protein
LVVRMSLCLMCNPIRGCGGCRIANGYRQGTPDGVREDSVPIEALVGHEVD